MFPFPKSAAKRALSQAQDLLRLADKVDCYRRDVVPAPALATLRAASARLQQLWEDKAHPDVLEKAADELHAAMLPCGGDIYPLTFASEYTEMIISAAILVIGFRTFFLEPFKIPTNSMYPTYNGMTPYVYAVDQPGPNPLAQVFNLLTQGAVHHELRAPAAGEVMIPLTNGIYSEYHPAQVRSWTHLWLSSDVQREYRIYVGNMAVADRVPQDFDYGFDQAIYQTYFPEIYKQAWNDPPRMYALLEKGGHIRHDDQGRTYLATGHKVQAGDPVLDFDLRTGDMLFVDRFSYNFIAPKPGDPIVFHTSGIKDLYTVEPNGQLNQDDQNYIKRLVGAPGDVMEVHPPLLYRNGLPNTGAAAFDKNGHQVENYPGYTFGNLNSYLPAKFLLEGQTFEVPKNHYFAMGDNSPTSYDGRYWGPVPAPNIVGRAVVIIYPFTFRWGLAK